MERNIIKELNMNARDEVVTFLKSLWSENPNPCPLCGGNLEYLHKKAKKSNNDWKCIECGKIYRAIDILMNLPDR